MFDHTSRYYRLPIATLTLPDGHAVSFVRRRILPQGDDLPLLAEIAVAQGDRIDTFTNRTLGDPLAFWRICDANNAMEIQELVAQPGRMLRVPVPQA
jgi:hypothetical protein